MAADRDIEFDHRMRTRKRGVDIATGKVTVDLRGGENRQPAYMAKNPAGQMPCLELDDGSVLMDAVASNPANRAVDVLFMSILSRLPDAGESEFVKASILAADSIPSGIRDVAWALLNTREFLFIQ